MNTVLLIEPRFFESTSTILENTRKHLGDWKYVFYCGKSFKEYWENKLPFVEVRALDHDNFENSNEYNDFCKSRELWDSLYGEFVLTIQMDTWIMNIKPFTIDFFMDLDKSFIGGNMAYTWRYYDNIHLHHSYRNFNGGLSLRKRNDMIRVIESFPPLKTLDNQTNFLTENEDVYFTTGCIILKLPVGDDAVSSHFSIHSKYHDKYFGIHQPSWNIKPQLSHLKSVNPYLNL